MKRQAQNAPKRTPFVILLFAVFILLVGCSHNFDPRFTPMDEDVSLGRKYYMKQKFWTLGEQFVIRNQNQEALFQVKGRFFSIGDKLSFQDMEGRELAYISEQVISLLKRYRIYRPDGSHVVVRKNFTLFSDTFSIKVPGDEGLTIRGNIWDLEYAFIRRGRLVAIVSKKLVSWNDSYTIQVVRGEDDILILASAVIIDMIKADQQSSEHAGGLHISGVHRK